MKTLSAITQIDGEHHLPASITPGWS